MKRRYVLVPQATRDLFDIWRYLKKESNEETAERVESVIRSKFAIWRRFQAAAIGGVT